MHFSVLVHMRKKYTDEEFEKIVLSSKSIREVLKRMSLAPAGGNYTVFHARVKRLGLKTNHFGGHGWSKGKQFGPKRVLQDYLDNKFKIGSFALKNRLIKERVFNRVCSHCKRKTWNKQPIPLELDHINGNNQDNSLSNLRLLCPNCHAQTHNYRGKNKGKY